VRPNAARQKHMSVSKLVIGFVLIAEILISASAINATYVNQSKTTKKYLKVSEVNQDSFHYKWN